MHSALPAGRAVVFYGAGQPFKLIHKQVPAIKHGEILVKNLYTTICGSDVHTWSGRRLEPPQVVLGHEITGEILYLHPGHTGVDLRVEKLAVGDRITWSIFSVPPGNPAPRPDIPQKSSNLFKYGHALAEEDDVFNGGLADYCILRNNTAVIKISPAIPLQVAATISCAHSTVAGALRVAGDIAGKKVLVFGMGLLGISCAAMCREAGAAWIGAIDTDARRLELSLDFGADAGYNIADYASGRLPWPEADIVFDMTGVTQAMEAGLESLRTGGVAVWIGAAYPNSPVKVDAQKMVRKVLQIRGLHNYNFDDFLAATAFIEQHYLKYNFEVLVEKEFTLEQTEEAFAFAGSCKPVRAGVRL